MVGLYDFAQGGTKLMRQHTVTVSGQRSYNNGGEGLWFDTDNMNATITGAQLAGNRVDNLQIEANEGPVTLENSSLCGGDVGVRIVIKQGESSHRWSMFVGQHFCSSGVAADVKICSYR